MSHPQLLFEYKGRRGDLENLSFRAAPGVRDAVRWKICPTIQPNRHRDVLVRRIHPFTYLKRARAGLLRIIRRDTPYHKTHHFIGCYSCRSRRRDFRVISPLSRCPPSSIPHPRGLIL